MKFLYFIGKYRLWLPVGLAAYYLFLAVKAADGLVACFLWLAAVGYFVALAVIDLDRFRNELEANRRSLNFHISRHVLMILSFLALAWVIGVYHYDLRKLSTAMAIWLAGILIATFISISDRYNCRELARTVNRAAFFILTASIVAILLFGLLVDWKIKVSFALGITSFIFEWGAILRHIVLYDPGELAPERPM